MTGGTWWRAGLIAVLASGCDLLFQLDHVERNDGGGGSADGSSSDGASVDGDGPMSACAKSDLEDDFSSSLPCVSWGMTYSSGGGNTTGNGLWTITPMGGVANSTGCISNSQHTFGAGGVAVRVADIVRGPGTYTMLRLGGGVDIWIIATGGDGLVRFQNMPGGNIGPPVLYSPDTAWWRIVPTPPAFVVAEYSADGAAWKQLGTLNVTAPPATVGVEINAGTNGGTPVGSTKFDHLRICP